MHQRLKRLALCLALTTFSCGFDQTNGLHHRSLLDSTLGGVVVVGGGGVGGLTKDKDATAAPTANPTPTAKWETEKPTKDPTHKPTKDPTHKPTEAPTPGPTPSGRDTTLSPSTFTRSPTPSYVIYITPPPTDSTFDVHTRSPTPSDFNPLAVENPTYAPTIEWNVDDTAGVVIAAVVVLVVVMMVLLYMQYVKYHKDLLDNKNSAEEETRNPLIRTEGGGSESGSSTSTSPPAPQTSSSPSRSSGSSAIVTDVERAR